MDVDHILEQAGAEMSARRVFGEPIERDGTVLVPVARVSGGGGGGTGTQDGAEGAGGGLGVSARPVGAYVIRGDRVTWLPAIDTTRVIVLGQVVAIIALLVLRSVLKRGRRR
jgi:uncharacterized spore protein YtfJ